MAQGKGIAGENTPRWVRRRLDACTRHQRQCWR